MNSMKNLLFLCLCLLCSSCATESTLFSADFFQSKNTVHIKNNKIVMVRAEAERILGSPTSVTDTATGTTAVWVFGPGASKATPPPEPKGYSGILM